MYPSCLYGESYEEDSTGCHIVDERNEKICELQNINDKLSSALNSAVQRIDKAIELVNNIYFGNFFSELEPIKLADSKEGKELLSILKGEQE